MHGVLTRTVHRVAGWDSVLAGGRSGDEKEALFIAEDDGRREEQICSFT